MKYKFILFIFALVLCGCGAQNDCDVTYLEDGPNVVMDWTALLIKVDTIKDVDKLDLSFSFSGSLEVTTPNNDDDGANYIEALIEDGTLKIRTTDYFSTNFELDMISKDPAPSQSFTRSIQLTCNGTPTPRPFTLTLYVQDTNNHDPAFVTDTYTFTMPMPLAPKIDLTGFGDPITAQDIDFSNTGITFVADNPDFDVDFEAQGDRTFRAILKAKNFVRFTDDATITITATDSGTPPRTGTAKVIIQKDPDVSIPDSPLFKQAIYKLQYVDESSPLDDGGIQIILDTDDPDSVSVSLDDDTNFEAVLDPASKVVTINIANPVEITTTPVIPLTLTATLPDGGTTQTAILVYLPPQLVITTLTFSEPYYTATYSTDSDPHTVTLDGDQVISIVENVENVAIDLKGDPDHFSLSPVDGVWTLKVENNLGEERLKEGGDITLSLDATVSEDGQKYEGFGVVVIKLPEVLEVPRFAKSYYKADYVVNSDESQKDSVKLEENIIINPTTEDVTLEMLDYVENFHIEQNEDQWQIIVDDNLDPADVKKGGQIIVSLKATVTGTDVEPGYGSVVINLPTPPEIPGFEYPLYTADYIVGDGADTLELNVPIKTTLEDAEVTIAPSDYSSYFGIDCDATLACTITVKDGLSSTDFKQKDIVLTLKAALPSDETESSTSILVITLPELEIPRFSNAYYIARYKLDENGVGYITPVKPVIISSPQDKEVSVNFAEVTNYFDIEQDPDDKTKWIVSVAQNVPDFILKNGGIMALTLQAFVPGADASSVAKSTLIIEYPPVDAGPKYVKFDQPSYTFSYKIEDDTPSVDQGGQTISISNPEDDVSVTIIDGNHKESFDVEQNPDNTFNIIIKSPLEQTVLDTELDILLVLDAALEGDDDGFTTVLINLPKKIAGIVPHFLESTYHAEYQIDEDGSPTVTLKDGPIQLSSTDNINVAFIETYSENFTFNLDGDPQITVSDKLDDGLIKENQEILLTLQVSFDGSTTTESTVIELKLLPHVDVLKTFKFNQPLYTFSYTLKDDTPSIEQNDQTIGLSNGEEGVKVDIIDGNYKENFEVEMNPDGTYNVKITTPLSQLVLDTELDTVLVLSAVLEGNEDGFTTVLMNLPKKEAGVAPQFKQAAYEAFYTQQEDGNDAVRLSNQIDLQGELIGEPTISFKEPNHNFEIKNNEDGTYGLIVSDNLDDPTLINQVDVVLTLQATVENVAEIGEAALVIHLPKETSPAAFTQPLYEALYIADPDSPHVEINEPIALSGRYKTETKVSLEANGFEGFFELDENYNVIVTNPLDDTAPKEKEIVLTLTSSFENNINDLTTTATVVIQRPRSPKFDSATYTAKYVPNEDNTATITPNPNIGTDAADPASVKITAESPYADNFKIAYDADQKEYTVSVALPLDGAIVDSEPEILVTLVATVDGAADYGTAGLVLKTPEKTANVLPQFSDIRYEATYTHNDEAYDSVDFLSEVKIISDHADDTEVKVLPPYDVKFTPYLDNGVWQLRVDEKLEDSLLSEYSIIYVSLEAELSDSAFKGAATVVLDLPTSEKKPSPKFTKPYYVAEYEDLESAEPIEVSDSPDKELVDVTIEDSYAKYFTLTRGNGQWKIEAGDSLEAETLKKGAELHITLTAHLENSVADGTSTLIVTLPAKKTISFEQDVYKGTYASDMEAGSSISTDNDITITLDGSTVEPTGEYGDFFTVEPNAEDKYTLLVKTPLTQEILSSESEIVLVLKGTNTEITDDEATATVIIKLPLHDTITPLYFEKDVYFATYDESGDLTVDGEIVLDGDIDSSAVITLDGDYGEFFKYTRTGNTLTITTTGPLDDSVLGKSYIVIDINAAKESLTAVASLVVELPKAPDSTAPQFSRRPYVATYNIKDGALDEVVLEEGPLGIAGVDASDQVITITGDYEENFSVEIEEDQWVLKVKEDLPSTVIETKVSILLNLEVTLTEDSSTPGHSVVVVQLPKKVAAASFSFDKNIYMADYEVVDDEPNLSVEDIIIQGSSDKINVETAGDYKNKFSASVTDGKVNVELTGDLSDVTDPVISVDIVATKQTDDGGVETVTVSLVVKLPIETSTTLEFSLVAYTAAYTITSDEKDKVELEGGDVITINGISSTDLVDIVIESDYKDNFELVPEDDHWTLNLVNNLSPDVIADQVSILLNLKATSEDGNVGQAGVVVKLPKKITSYTFGFKNNVYMADYDIHSNQPLVVEEDITMDGQWEGVTVAIPEEYKDVIKVDFTDGKVTLTLVGDLTDSENPVISIDITATKLNEDGTTETTKASLVIKRLSDFAQVLEFSEIAYTATYTIKDDSDEVTLDNGPIKIEGVTDPNTIDLTVESENFELVPEGDHWNLVVKADLTTETIFSEVSILLNLKATPKENPTNKGPGYAGVIVKLPKKIASASFSFDSVVYMADYEVDDDEPKFEVENEIALSGDVGDSVSVELQGEHKDHFDVSLVNGKITISLKENLSDVTEPVISVDILATKSAGGSVETAAASLVVKLQTKGVGDTGSYTSNDDSSDDKTGLIAAVAVLAVLLVASLVGSAVFYYLKFKRAKSYSNMEEAEPRFTKNTDARGAYAY